MHQSPRLRVFTADEDVANAVQPHPHLPVLATSGIESTVKVGSGQLSFHLRMHARTPHGKVWAAFCGLAPAGGDIVLEDSSSCTSLRAASAATHSNPPAAPPMPLQLWSPEGEPTTGGNIGEAVRRNQERLKEGAPC